MCRGKIAQEEYFGLQLEIFQIIKEFRKLKKLQTPYLMLFGSQWPSKMLINNNSNLNNPNEIYWDQTIHH